MFPPSLCVDFGGGIGKNIYEGFKDSNTELVQQIYRFCDISSLSESCLWKILIKGKDVGVLCEAACSVCYLK